MRPSIGILGVGVFLPSEVRTNAWWPAHVVASWQAKAAERAAGTRPAGPAPTAGQGRILAAMAERAGDPFHGAVERRVAPDEMRSSQMEIAAARQALERAGVAPGEIDFVLVHSVHPDFLNSPNACVVHAALELPERALALSLDGSMCNSFLQQLAIAEGLVSAGRARRGLLVQSSNLTRLANPGDPSSPWFGDGATAVVVGPVAQGRGILGRADRADGSYGGALVFGVPSKRWHEEGRIMLYSESPSASWRMLINVADMGRQIVHEALTDAGLAAGDVTFYASHQATRWFRAVTQEHIGLSGARAVDTFPWAGSLSGANIPLSLAVAEREGMLHDGDVVAMFAGGSGITWSSVILSWGRG